jgi:hypothetical protein
MLITIYYSFPRVLLKGRSKINKGGKEGEKIKNRKKKEKGKRKKEK